MKQAEFDGRIEPLLGLGGVPRHVVELRNRILEELDHKILMARTAISKFDRARRLNPAQKVQFSLLEKKDVDKAIKAVEATVETFAMNQKTILGYLRINDIEIDKELDRRTLSAERGFREAKRVDKYTSKRPIILESRDLKAYEAQEIPFSCGAKRAYHPQDPKSLCIIDSDDNIPADGVVLEDAMALALKLHNASPEEFGLLPCRGLTKHPRAPTQPRRDITMVFRFPQQYSTVNSLRRLLLETQGGLAQTPQGRIDRLAMAKHLVKAVFSVHLYDFVHKNIRPETLMCFGTAAEEQNGRLPQNAFLIGFEVMRIARGHSDKAQTRSAQEAANLYQHPERLRSDLDDSELYVMQHDVYSLGVCLLEIGLWRSFVTYDDRGAKVGRGLRLPDGRMPSADAIKNHLVNLSGPELVGEMGVEYSEVVRRCLTCLDGGKGWITESDFLSNPYAGGVTVRSSYTRDVLSRINNIVDMDV